MYASDIGERAKATAIEVPRSMRSVEVAARARGRNGSLLTSPVKAPSYPSASAASASAAAALELAQGRVDQHQEDCERPRAVTSARRSATWLVPGSQVSAMYPSMRWASSRVAALAICR